MKVLKWLDLHFEEACLTVFLIALTVLVTMNVVLRYIFGTGLTWSEAICRYCLVYSTFLTIAHWVRRNSGICVDFILQIVPKQVAAVLKWIVKVLQIVFFFLLFPHPQPAQAPGEPIRAALALLLADRVQLLHLPRGGQHIGR